VREAELRCACAALGIQPPLLLNYQDAHLSEANPEQVIAQILQVVRRVGPQVMLTFGPDGLSGHPDHIAIGRWAEEAFQRSETVSALYTVAVPQSLATRMGMAQVRPVPDKDIAVTVDVSSVWERKMAAIRCHATQLSSSPVLREPDERLRMFLGTECFVRAHSRVGAATIL
jgi:LmbE family N-acetylglucosaminyl deacetylase